MTGASDLDSSVNDSFQLDTLRPLAAVVICILAASRLCFSATASADDAAAITPAADAAIRSGLDFLANRQHADGAMGSTNSSRRPAVAALAGMAWLASGSTPGRGPYGENVERAVSYVLANSREDGFISISEIASHGPMYGHAFCTLFLAEAYGMTDRVELRAKLTDAIKLIVDTQNEDGGWRYQPRRQDADISVTVCQIMALRAARNAGLHVPRETVDQCVEYVKKCQNEDGGFRYMLEDGPSDFPRTAAALVALNSAGVYSGQAVDDGLSYLIAFIPGPDKSYSYSHYFYGQYYAVQAMWHAEGPYWNRWFPAIRDELVERQLPDGSWSDSYSPEYGTSMACIVLQVPNDYLPILQR